MQNIRLKIGYLIVIGLGLCELAAKAAPVAVATVPGLVSSADIVIIGTVNSVQPPKPQGNGRLTLSINDLFKGSYTGGLLDLAYEAQSVGAEQNMVGEQVLAFGKLNGDGQSYTLLPMCYGPGALLSDEVMDIGSPMAVPALAISAQDTPIQKVIKELGIVQISSATTKASLFLLSLPPTRVEPDVTEAVFRAIQSSEPKSSAVGAAGLVAMGDISGLEAADSLDTQNHPELTSVVTSIESSFNDTSQAGLQILVRWLGPSMPAVNREAAAGALARIHTPDAILQLGSALNDGDFEVRWRAIGGLSMFANNVPIGGVNPAPGPWSFRKVDTIKFSAFDRKVIKNNENDYLTFWRQWWNQNQGQIQALATASR